MLRASMSSSPTRYRQAGVDIEKKYAAVDAASAAIRKSFTPGVIGDVGAFGGLFDPTRVGCGGQLLVASADGVGTKLSVARRAERYDTLGHDIVNHCIDDILVQGARPLFFMDYIAVGRMDPEVVSQLIGGCASACTQSGLALLGGETAEMPGLYAPGDFDLAGFIVGSVAREKLLDGSRVKPGQVLLGLESSGLHTNGYSLARRILFDELGLELDTRPAELGGRSVVEALLAVHRSYFSLLWPLLEQDALAALAHITGGGLVDNVPRVLNGCDACIDRTSWTPAPLFRFLCERGNVTRDEAYQVFNMGIGMVLFVERDHERAVKTQLEARGERVHVLGHTEKARGAEGVVRWLDG